MTCKKDEWIARLVPEATFVDIGGLWGTLNEKASVAIRAGARETTMSDIARQDHVMWRDFDAHCAKLGISGYRKATVDIVAPEPEKILGVHDVVHCSGIIYHLPDPFLMLQNLKRVTGKHLIVTSMVVPGPLDTAAGKLDIGPDNAYFVPGLAPHSKAVLAAHFDALGIRIAAINAPLEEPWMFPGEQPNYGPWWWVYTPDFLKQLVRTAGFEIEDECWSWERRAYSVLARPIA
jgi:hypothetical protein